MPDSLHEVEQQLYERLEQMRKSRMSAADENLESMQSFSQGRSEPLSAKEKWEQELEERYNWSETMRPKRKWNLFGIFG